MGLDGLGLDRLGMGGLDRLGMGGLDRLGGVRMEWVG